MTAQAEAARYIATLTGQLADIARSHRLPVLGRLLDMVRLEAESTEQRNGAGR